MASDLNVVKNRVSKALSIAYSDAVADKFVEYIDEEAFDLDTLREDLEDAQAAKNPEESAVVEAIAEDFPSDFPSGRKEEKRTPLCPFRRMQRPNARAHEFFEPCTVFRVLSS